MVNVLPGSVDDPQPLPAVAKTLEIFNINLLVVLFVLDENLVSLDVAFDEVLLSVARLLPHHLPLMNTHFSGDINLFKLLKHFQS